MDRLLRHRQTKETVTDKPHLTPPRHISTLLVSKRGDFSVHAAHEAILIAMHQHDPLNVSKALVTGFDYDVFVSYAHDDNLVPAGASGRGWVTRLAQNLNSVQSALRKRVFIDNQLKPGDAFDDALKEKVARSAVLLLLLSRNYLASEWCGTELEHFIQARSDDPQKPRHVFVVELLPFERIDRVPAVVERIRSQLLHCKLWYWSGGAANGVHRLAGSPSPGTDEDHGTHYWREVEALVQAIDHRLLEIKMKSGEPPARPAGMPETPPTAASVPAPIAGAVLLADVTDDLESKRSEVVAALRRECIPVVPEGDFYGLTAEELASGLGAALAQSVLFVQLLSATPGRKPPGGELPLPQLQLQMARHSGIAIMQWHDPALDVASILDADHAELFRSPELHVVNLERFKEELVLRHGKLIRPSPPTRPTRPTTRRIFLDDPSPDADLREGIREILCRHGCEVRSPVNGQANDPAALAELLRICGGGITIYREARDRLTISFRLMRCLNLIAERQLNVARWGVWLGAQPARNDLYAELGIDSKDLFAIPGFAGIDEPALVSFIQGVPPS